MTTRAVALSAWFDDGFRVESGRPAPEFLIFAVRPDGAYHQWRKDPSRELSIALVADERFGRVTGWIEAS
jgi:hypothetical protein